MKAITTELLKALSESLPVRVCIKRGTYKEWLQADLIPLDGELILVTELPWHKSWFGLKPNRLKVGDGKTSFNKLKFL